MEAVNLYLLEQVESRGYDTYPAAVVRAESPEAARHLHPNGTCAWNGRGWARPKDFEDQSPTYVDGEWGQRHWASCPDHVTATLLGTSLPNLPPAVVLAAFTNG